MKLIVKSLLFAGLLFFGLNVSAQSVSDAGNLYNQANQQFKNKAFGQAVKLYEQALQTCKDAGPDAFSLQTQVQTQLGKAYFWNGISFYQQRNFDEAIAQLEKGIKMNTLSGDSKFKALSVDYAARVYASKGNASLMQKNYADAAAQYDAALKVDPNSINAYYGKCLLAKEQKNLDEMATLVKKVGTLVSTNSKGPQLYGQARQMAFAAYLNEGASELQKEKYADALTNFDKANEFYSGSATLYYYVALANVKLKKWDAAISNGQKALSMERNSKSDIYFTLGQAYEGKGLNDSACKEYKNVTTGPNVAAAKYQIKNVLKCK
ncbi:MAG: tetratricopeptide repeat protein [Bacteroidales bacterium]|nr:tetratricopeptide repeat protein [Bacteroidales bacterium]